MNNIALNQACQQVYDNVKGALACAVVALEDGQIKGIYHQVPYFDESYVSLVAKAAWNMFAGPDIVEVEQRLSAQKGKKISRSIEEGFMTTTHTFHFMVRISEIDCVVVLITSKDVLQGLGWSQLRKTLPLFVENF